MYDNCMTKMNKNTEYKQFTNARLEPELHEWLKGEKKKYSSWNQFFKKLKEDYDKMERE